MTESPETTPDERQLASDPIESAPAPWIQALFVEDAVGFRTHFFGLLRHAKPMCVDTTPAARSAHARDLDLVRRACGDDPWAGQELADRLSCVPAMVRARHRKLGAPLSDEELKDVVQDTLVTVLSRLESFEGRSSLETWAYGFVVRELYKGFDRLRRRPRRVEWSDERSAGLVDESHTARRDDYSVVHDTIHSIGPPGSEIIRLKHFQLMTFEEIAEELEMPLGTVKTRYYRSVERLRVLLRSHWREMVE